MTDEIKSNIKDILNRESHSKESTTYFLVESYKYLERNKQLSSYKVIKLYRNWACHSYLSSDADKIFEELYILVSAKKYISNSDEPPWSVLVMKELQKDFANYSLNGLKKEIKRFSKNFLDDTPFLDWSSFRDNVSEVIKDIPLIIVKNKKEIFRLVCKKAPTTISPRSLSIFLKCSDDSKFLVAV